VNDAPVAQGQSVVTEEDTAVGIVLEGSDVDGDSLSYQVVRPPEHGVLSGAGAQWSYEPAANYNGPDQFEFRVSDGALESAAAVVALTVRAVNDAPVAEVAVGPLWEWSEPGALRIVAGDNQGAWVVLDGSRSSDAEGDELEPVWFRDGELLPLATGAVVTNWFEVGWHQVVLVVDDGQDAGQAEAGFEVIPPSVALEAVVLQVYQSGLARNRKQPLVASLKAAMASFDRESWGSGVNQLEAFENKVRAQVAPTDAALAEELHRAVHTILETIR